MIDNENPSFNEFFVGWSVVSVGKTEFYYWESKEGKKYDSTVEGGLTFILAKNGMLRKVILGYTELGEWIEHCEDISTNV